MKQNIKYIASVVFSVEYMTHRIIRLSHSVLFMLHTTPWLLWNQCYITQKDNWSYCRRGGDTLLHLKTKDKFCKRLMIANKLLFLQLHGSQKMLQLSFFCLTHAFRQSGELISPQGTDYIWSLQGTQLYPWPKCLVVNGQSSIYDIPADTRVQ